MPARQISRTYSVPAAHAKVMAAREELEAETVPMHRWPHPIPKSASEPAAPVRAEAPSSTAVQILEKLQYQNQVLTDLLGAVNALTAAVLCRKSCPTEGEV